MPAMEFRPTQAIVREAFFDIVDVAGAEILDLYAGSGSIGLEALSRGAVRVTFVDSSMKSVLAIRESLAAIRAAGEAVRAAALKFLATTDATYNLIFADPPYDSSEYPAIMQTVRERKLLTAEGLLVLEIEKHNASFAAMEQHANDIRRYGKSFLLFIPPVPV
jgi:16S rRNA (guanine966-N2)-methyltransferase